MRGRVPKLNETIVRDIVRQGAEGTDQSVIATQYGVHRSTINRVLSGHILPHVERQVVRKPKAAVRLSDEQRRLVAEYDWVAKAEVSWWLRRFVRARPYSAELLQEARLGLCIAASKFDASRAYSGLRMPFVPYAKQWAQSLVRGVYSRLVSPVSGVARQRIAEVESRTSAVEVVTAGRPEDEGASYAEPSQAADAEDKVHASELLKKMQADMLHLRRSLKRETAEREFEWWTRNRFREETLTDMARESGVTKELVRQRVDRMEVLFQHWRQTASL